MDDKQKSEAVERLLNAANLPGPIARQVTVPGQISDRLERSARRKGISLQDHAIQIIDTYLSREENRITRKV
jgi:LDH2 family malate/lactate/ureidoglycolate dehydrogenase